MCRAGIDVKANTCATEFIPYKEILEQHLLKYKLHIHKQMGLFAYFILLADRFLNTDGKMAFVLPASFLRVNSCRKVRDFVIQNYYVNYIIFRIDTSNFSENTSLREILFIATKKDLRKNNKNRWDFEKECKSWNWGYGDNLSK